MRALLPLRIALLLSAFATLCLPTIASAQTDEGRARDELEHGYALRKEGKYEDALPLLLDSYHLAPQLKTLINVADCEEHLGKLADARGHWLLARAQATKEGEAAIAEEARKRVESLEKRTPQLILRLPADASTSTEVVLDGELIAADALGTRLFLDAGSHNVLVRLEGHEPRRYQIDLAEGERRTVELVPGALWQGYGREESSGRSASTWRAVGWTTVAVGAAGVVVGGLFGIEAIVKKGDAHCPSNACANGGDPDALRTAVKDGNLATAFIVVGGVLAATGVTILVVAPRQASPGSTDRATSSSPRASLALLPTGVWLQGAW